jgi:uncharacterized protein
MLADSPVLFHCLLPVAGFVVGVFGSFTGLGGAIIMVPALANVFGLPYNMAIGCNLASMAGMAVTGLVRHYRLGHVRLALALNFMAGSIPGAYLGRELLHLLGARYGLEGHLKTAINTFFMGVLVISLAMIALRYYRSRRNGGAAPEAKPPRIQGRMAGRVTVGLAGLAAGLLAGLLSVGGGLIAVPVLAGLLGVPVQIAVGTSMFQMAPMAVSGTLASLGTPDLDWTVIALLFVGSLPGASLGPVLLNRLVKPPPRPGPEGPIV